MGMKRAAREWGEGNNRLNHSILRELQKELAKLAAELAYIRSLLDDLSDTDRDRMLPDGSGHG